MHGPYPAYGWRLLYGRLYKVRVGMARDKRLPDAGHVELWECNKLTASQR